MAACQLSDVAQPSGPIGPQLLHIFLITSLDLTRPFPDKSSRYTAETLRKARWGAKKIFHSVFLYPRVCNGEIVGLVQLPEVVIQL